MVAAPGGGYEFQSGASIAAAHVSGLVALLTFLLGALCGAFRDLLTRKVRASESPAALLAFMMAAMALAGFTTLPFGWAPVTAFDLILLATAGILIGGAQYLVIHAFYIAEAGVEGTEEGRQ